MPETVLSCGQKIYNTVKGYLPPIAPGRAKRKILFLPYMASMWDSFESVWRAVCEDPDAEAIVMPIPYCYRNPDGSPKKWLLETPQFPAYVRTVDWQSYDLGAEMPDIIFIHYPYDDGNAVTSIHPDYYSLAVREKTSLLVYIPYFINGDRVHEDLCTTMAVAASDIVIVKDENEKQQYLDVIKAYEEKNDCPGVFGNAEQKLFPLGNPKFDRVKEAVSKKDDYERALPPEWKKVLYSSDGIRKKLIFYNTSLQQLMVFQGAYLDKMERAFGIFKDNADVAALLWRPHPLMKSTIDSMFPDLSERYDSIVKKFVSDGIGIFDESSEFERAMAVSDAYYGDSSSVAVLYRETERPMMIQNINC